MTIFYRLQGVDFEWDFNKAQSNVEKHGVTFEESDASANNELRNFILGYSLAQRLLLVIYLERLVRI